MTRATAGFVPHITPDAAQSSVVDACGFRLRSNVEDVCGESGEASQIYRMTPVADERGEHNADPLYLVATAEIPWVIIKQQQTLDGFSPPESPSRLISRYSDMGLPFRILHMPLHELGASGFEKCNIEARMP
ncbi:hypothetical protein GGH98_002065 [Coemansia sp. RSA 454]|nr:hypothetical protein GGH98_002065 [Coemansia sp. RSA 454]